MTPVAAHFYGGPLHGEKAFVNEERVVSVVIDARGGVATLREVGYRRVERGRAYGGIVYEPPGDRVPYVFEDWLP